MTFTYTFRDKSLKSEVVSFHPINDREYAVAIDGKVYFATYKRNVEYAISNMNDFIASVYKAKEEGRTY